MKFMNTRCFHSGKLSHQLQLSPSPRKFARMLTSKNTVCDLQFGGLSGTEGLGRLILEREASGGWGEDPGSTKRHCGLWQVTWAVLSLLSSSLKWADATHLNGCS